MSVASPEQRCPKCGGPIPTEAPQGLCPKCLLAEVCIPTEADGTSNAVPPALAELSMAFPHLEIFELIGQGGMGFVFKARQPKLDRFVALKILPQSLAADPAFAERFTREGRVLARLSHPNIVTIHDFGSASGFFYLLMEYVDGVNLRQAMRAGRFTPDQALAIVPKVCEALQYAHNEGILHRDIKPENILLDTKGRVKIADFGIAKLVGEAKPDLHLTGSGATLGTPHYMAPEQVEHPGSVDHRADIYSLGVVFYEMLTGELPLGRFAPPSEKSGSDPRLDDVVFRTLDKEPARRPQSAGEVKTQVETIASDPSADAARAKPPMLSATVRSGGSGGRSAVPSSVNRWPARIFWLIMAAISIPAVLVAVYLLLPLFVKQRSHTQKDGIPMARVSIQQVETRDHLVLVTLQCETELDKFEMRPRLEGPSLDPMLQQRSLAIRDLQVVLPAPLGEKPFANFAWNAAGKFHQWRIAFALPDESTANAARAQIEERSAASMQTTLSEGRSAIFELDLPGGASYRAWLEFEPNQRVALVPVLSSAGSDVGQAIPQKQEAETSNDGGPSVGESPPVVVSTLPVSGTRDVKPGRAEIRVRFSKEMQDSSWSWSTAWEGSTPKLIGEPRFESDRRTCVINVELEPERTYAFWLNSEKFQNFKDPSGRAAVPYLLIFRTVQK